MGSATRFAVQRTRAPPHVKVPKHRRCGRFEVQASGAGQGSSLSPVMQPASIRTNSGRLRLGIE
jgi:hypothetical protein